VIHSTQKQKGIEEVQRRKIEVRKIFHFKQWETIFMELSQKFDLEMIEALAIQHNFKVEKNFTDNRNYFVDSLWVKI
jgi:uncharacterized SAM-dependent methyltransferase